MALISDKSDTHDIDHTDAIDPDDHGATTPAVKSKEPILANDNGQKLSLAEKLKSKEIGDQAGEAPSDSSINANNQKQSVETTIAAQNPKQEHSPIVDTDKKIHDALAGAQTTLLNQVRQMMEEVNESSKVASLLEMAKRMIDAIIRMIESMLQRFGFIKGKKEGEGRQERDASKDQSAFPSQQKSGSGGPSHAEKNVQIAEQRSADTPSAPAQQSSDAKSPNDEALKPTTPDVAPEVANRLEQAEALINSIAGRAGEMLGKFLSDPFVQRHAERGDRPATVSALCDRALEVCRQDLASASAMLRELTADISGTDAQRIGMRPREAAQLILDGGIDPALINPKLKSKATLLIREYGPLADRLGAIRQAVGIIVADTVMQAEVEGAASTEILHKTLESLKSKLKTLGGGDDLAIARLGLNESFRAVGTAHIAMDDQSSSILDPAGETTQFTSEDVVISEGSTPLVPEMEISTTQEQKGTAAPESVPEQEAHHERFLVAANEEEFMVDGTESDAASSQEDNKGDHDRPRG
jgi:hypothetical protein